MNGEYLAHGHATPVGPPPAATTPLPAFFPGAAGTGPIEQAGDPRVDALVAGLGELSGRPVADHVAVYENLHHGLQEILSSTGQDGGGHDGTDGDGARWDAATPGTPRPAGPRPGPMAPGRHTP